MDHTGNDGSLQNNNSTRKKASSFAGFLGKILPTHRPEQGGTLRSMDDRSTESAYRRLDINPEELKEWNIAEDLPIRRRLELAEERANSSRRPEPPRPGTSPTAGRPPSPCKRTDRHLSAAETQHLLKRKQRSQRRHRELKASGDWLGVTGANPQTGQYNVLTPTESASSDLTPPSTKIEMRKLTKRVQQAERIYKTAKAMENAATERHMKKKAQMKLDKIELAKAEIQQQHGPLEWKRREREWSSVREPGLSPIAQSFTNTESETQSEGHVSDNDFAGGHRSSKGKQPVRLSPLSTPQRQERGNKLQKRRRIAEPSADTIIHTPSRQISASASPQGQGHDDSDTRADADVRVPNPLLGGKHFLWRRRRRATDPGGPGANKATVTSSLMTHKNERSHSLNLPCHQDHFNGLIIPDHRLGAVVPTAAQTGRLPLEEVNNVYPLQQLDILSPEYEGGMEDRNPSLPPPSQNDMCSSKDRTLRGQSIAVATAISSPLTSREPTKNHFDDLQKLDRSQSAIDLTKSMRRPQHPPALHPSEDVIAPYETNSRVNAREVTVQSTSEYMARLRSAENHTEKDLANPLKGCNQAGPHLSCQTTKGAEVQSNKEESVPEAVHPSTEMIREAECERTPECRNEIIETIERRDGTGQNNDSVFTPIITTTGYAHALLIQPISETMLGQIGGLATDSTGALATWSSRIEPLQPFGTLTSKAADSTRTSQLTTMQSGSPKHEYSRSVPIFGTASARIVEIRRPKSSAGTQSLLARGYLRSRKGEGMSAQRAISVPKSQLGAAQSNEKHREAIVQGAARTAIVQSREKVSNPQAAPPKEASGTEKGTQEAKEQKEEAEEQKKEEEETKEETTAKPEGEGEGTAGHSPPKHRKYDAIKTLQTIALVITRWVWATIRYWWTVMGPVFDGESELWKRRYQEESTWNDVGVFLFAGVSVIVGLASGVHAFKAVRCLL
ncbi:hypothetical protein PG985_004134 [Apiospora marii]|uniref:Uncharacterized protein n=1 Tax=Apiospora marii TaxID=335849 RepID=A0ABR1SG70_9PEZI